MKKIAIIGDSNSPHVSIRVKRFINTLDLNFIFVEKNYQIYRKEKINKLLKLLLNIPKIKILTILFINYLKLKKHKPDFIFLMHGDIYNIFLINLIKSKKILSLWGNDILIEQGANKNFISKILLKYSLQKAKKIFCVSSQISERVKLIQNNIGIGPEVLFYGIDLELYDKLYDPKCKIDLFISINDNTFLIYSPRWCKSEYNIIKIMNTFVKLKNIVSNIHLCIQSSTLNGADSNYLSKVLNIIKTNNLESHITLVGLLESKERIKILNRANLVISIPYSDGTPISVLEAMYFNKLVLCHQIPSIECMIEDNENGFLVNANDDHKFLQKIYFIIDNYFKNNRFTNITNNARLYVKTNANLKNEMIIYYNSFLYS